MREYKRWMRLDNAAKIFPAVKRRNWSNVFRLSVTLRDPVDPEVLQAAVREVAPRFPSMLVSLHRGLFWYYLEQVKELPAVRLDGACPLIHMTSRELRTCALRVLYYDNRIAVEFFHAITDGNGGLVFLKTLTAAYVTLCSGKAVRPEQGVLDWAWRLRDPAELEDSFPKVAGRVALSPAGGKRIPAPGRPGAKRIFVSDCCNGPVRCAAGTGPSVWGHRYGLSRGGYAPGNFRASASPEQEVGEGDHSGQSSAPVSQPDVAEFCLDRKCGCESPVGGLQPGRAVQGGAKPAFHASDAAADGGPCRSQCSAGTDVGDEDGAFASEKSGDAFGVRVVGERKGTLNISNLGLTGLPPELQPYVCFLDFIIGPQITYFNNCGVVSYQKVTRINLIRSLQEPELERRFLTKLVEQGLEVTVESNGERE